MIVLRSEDEIDSIRSAGKIIKEVFAVLEDAVTPGITTIELDRIALYEITKRGAIAAFKGYRGYPANICISINEQVVHGIPSKRRLEEGDIVSVDIGVKYRDFFADAAVTYGVGKINPIASKLIKVTKEALDAGIRKAICANRLSDISSAVQICVENNGFNVVRSFVGHGIGAAIHEDPEIPNYGKPGKGPRLEAGMVLAIEPMVNEGTFEVEILDDDWTAVTKDRKLSAHFEHTVVVNKEGPEILTI